MAFNLEALLPRGLRHTDEDVRWCFEVDRSPAPKRVAWQWERYRKDALAERSRGTFPSFAECARDAQAHGFSTGHPYELRDRPAMPASAWAGSRRSDWAPPDGNGAA